MNIISLSFMKVFDVNLTGEMVQSTAFRVRLFAMEAILIVRFCRGAETSPDDVDLLGLLSGVFKRILSWVDEN